MTTPLDLLSSSTRIASLRGCVGLLACVAIARLSAAGLPEPGPTLYGVILDAAGRRQTNGQVEIALQSASGGPIIAVTASLALRAGQYSYAVQIPAETPIAGQRPSPGHLPLTTNDVVWRVMDVRFQDQSIQVLAAGGGSNLTISSRARGTFRLLHASAGPDTDGNGLVDAWERQHFGRLGVDPQASAAGDGISNLTKMYLGIDPKGGNAVLPRFTEVVSLPGDAIQVKWSSEAGRRYRVLRSATLEGGYGVIGTVGATPPVNQFVDSPEAGVPMGFYQVELIP